MVSILFRTIFMCIYIILIIDFTQNIPVKKHNRKSHLKKSDKTGVFSKFPRYGEIKKFLSEKSRKHPTVAKVSSIGKTVEGRSIHLIQIGEKIGSEGKQIVYIDGGMHAREWAAITTTLYIIEQLLNDYANEDHDAKLLLMTFDFYIVPVLNVDGYEYTHTTDRMWRKNRGKNPGSKCIGVDLNRNYPFEWGGNGSSHNPCDQTYCGKKALSEPESTAVVNLIMHNKDQMKVYITLHSYGNWWLYPWGYNDKNSPNVKELKRVADIGHAALKAVYGTTYTVGSPGQIMYPAQGSDDWAHGVAKIPYVYCLEMRPGQNSNIGFLLPKSDIIPVGVETYAGIKAVAKAVINTKCKANVCHQVE